MSDIDRVLDALEKLGQKVDTLAAEQHQVNIQNATTLERLATAEAKIEEGKGIVVPLESRVTVLETSKDRLTKVDSRGLENDTRITKLETQRNTMWAAISSLPLIGGLVGWFASLAQQ